MSTPNIKVGQGNWGIKAGNLLGYANTEKKFTPVEFTSSRALNTATRVNASGNIEIVNANIPRIDYFGGQASLLVEPSAQNLCLQSSNYDVTWAPSFLTLTSGITSPSGSNDATLFESTSTGARFRQTVTLTSGTTYTFSMFGKFDALSSGFTMQVFDENATTYGSGCCQAFNLNEGTLGASGNVGAGFTFQSVGMENYGNGWYRCRMTVLMGYTPAAPRVGFRLGTQLSGGRPISVVSGTVNVWGAQLETGSVATSYIPTTTGSVTRNADVVSVSGVAGLIGQTEGTMYCEFSVDFNNRNADILSVDGGSTSDGFFMGIRNSSVVQLIVRTASANALIFQRTGVYPTGVNKLAIAYKNGDFAICLNGTTVQTNTSSITMPSVSINRVSIRRDSLYNLDQQLRIRAAYIYPTRLPNTTTDGSPSLQSITTL